MKYMEGLVRLARGNMTSRQFIRVARDRKRLKSMVTHVLEDRHSGKVRAARLPLH